MDEPSTTSGCKSGHPKTSERSEKGEHEHQHVNLLNCSSTFGDLDMCLTTYVPLDMCLTCWDVILIHHFSGLDICPTFHVLQFNLFSVERPRSTSTYVSQSRMSYSSTKGGHPSSSIRPIPKLYQGGLSSKHVVFLIRQIVPQSCVSQSGCYTLLHMSQSLDVILIHQRWSGRVSHQSYTLGRAGPKGGELATPPHPKGVGWPILHAHIQFVEQ